VGVRDAIESRLFDKQIEASTYPPTLALPHKGGGDSMVLEAIGAKLQQLQTYSFQHTLKVFVNLDVVEAKNDIAILAQDYIPLSIARNLFVG